jgi:hypothetical protein
VPPAVAVDALGAVRAFAEEPSAAHYLAATRALWNAQRRHKLSLLGRVVGNRRTEEGLEALARGAGLSPELLEALRALPAEARTGRRLTIIADLLTAHRLIDARASGGYRQLLRTLGPVPRRAAAGRRERRSKG